MRSSPVLGNGKTEVGTGLPGGTRRLENCRHTTTDIPSVGKLYRSASMLLLPRINVLTVCIEFRRRIGMKSCSRVPRIEAREYVVPVTDDFEFLNEARGGFMASGSRRSQRHHDVEIRSPVESLDAPAHLLIAGPRMGAGSPPF